MNLPPSTSTRGFGLRALLILPAVLVVLALTPAPLQKPVEGLIMASLLTLWAFHQTGGLTRKLFLVVLAATALLLAYFGGSVLKQESRRETAADCKQDLRTLDIAIAQWAAENDKRTDEPVTLADLRSYLQKAPPALRERGEDALGHAIPFDGKGPHVPAATKEATNGLVEEGYWAAYN